MKKAYRMRARNSGVSRPCAGSFEAQRGPLSRAAMKDRNFAARDAPFCASSSRDPLPRIVRSSHTRPRALGENGWSARSNPV